MGLVTEDLGTSPGNFGQENSSILVSISSST